MKSTRLFSIAFSLLIATLMLGGCASSNCGCNSGNGLFGTNILQNQPIRSTVRSWFQGDSCDSCNTPAGQLTQPVCPETFVSTFEVARMRNTLLGFILIPVTIPRKRFVINKSQTVFLFYFSPGVPPVIRKRRSPNA